MMKERTEQTKKGRRSKNERRNEKPRLWIFVHWLTHEAYFTCSVSHRHTTMAEHPIFYNIRRDDLEAVKARVPLPPCI